MLNLVRDGLPSRTFPELGDEFFVASSSPNRRWSAAAIRLANFAHTDRCGGWKPKNRFFILLAHSTG